jgi:hypothetical protein
MLGVGQEVDSRAAFVSKKKYNDVALLLLVKRWCVPDWEK